MTNSELKTWIISNKELLTTKFNEYTEAANIKLSEFTPEQKQKLIVSIATACIRKELGEI